MQFPSNLINITPQQLSMSHFYFKASYIGRIHLKYKEIIISTIIS